MIGIDWGTSSFRAYRMETATGAVLDRLETGQGILEVPPGGFPDALRAAIGPWLAAAGGPPLVLLCGMVGSRQGWVEAPYLACPAGPAEIARSLTPVAFEGAGRCLLVPGLSSADPAGVPDVMRGEETKLVGLLAEIGGADALASLPGTHSKWARISGGRVAGFATHMTGEVHHLFGTRALGLMGRLAPGETDSYLSGLLIGHEMAAALAEGAPAGPVHLAGSETLCRLYAMAFDAFGLAHRRHEADLAARGLALIARGLA
jgi:2-dehydro-3-deoxygalactonokinase